MVEHLFKLNVLGDLVINLKIYMPVINAEGFLRKYKIKLFFFNQNH